MSAAHRGLQTRWNFDDDDGRAGMYLVLNCKQDHWGMGCDGMVVFSWGRYPEG